MWSTLRTRVTVIFRRIPTVKTIQNHSARPHEYLAGIAKNVLQVHAVDAQGKVITNRVIQRKKFLAWCTQSPAGCMVATEACGGARRWCRQLLRIGLDARMVAAALVSPYRMQGKGGKNDANDAAVICEAASRP